MVSADQAKWELTWLLPHEPLRVFERSADFFKKEIEQASNGQIKVNVVSYKDYDKTLFNNPQAVLKRVQSNEVQMSQIYAHSLTDISPQFHVLDMPYLFEDDQHVERVVEGSAGKQLLAQLNGSGVEGLGFTYSGGFKVIATRDQKLNSADDLKNMKMRMWQGHATPAMFKNAGVQPAPRSDAKGKILPQRALREGHANGVETTLALLDQVTEPGLPMANQVYLSYHAVHLTGFVVSEQFMSQLPANLQQKVREIAQVASRIERKQAIDDGKQFLSEFKAAGGKVDVLPAPVKSVFKAEAEKIQAGFAKDHGTQIIDAVRKQGAQPLVAN